MDIEGTHAAIRLPEGNWWDWDVIAWDGAQLRLAAGHDLAYHHGLELIFGSPFFVCCPSAFYDPTFRAPTADELHRATRQFGETPPVVVAFEADAGGQEPVSCLIAAERLDIVEESVLRYWREDAGPDQRFAPWVRPPHRQAAPEPEWRP
ncbi:hypothetical protein SUDANB120_00555 [Streptomyces sp. enrichment culture]|uniref:hypothetical protein n=1 Tax=Streptomyces TaxID=1883 RepID=UPI00167972B9|nr:MULTISPECIES: hypothetical protein [Streptomyces]MBD3580057.1 hypothetical protein [Streptomyces sp. KD18]GGT20639.1 hypothetical protein GCM10010286_52740 [Streptomyces toxytricini]